MKGVHPVNLVHDVFHRLSFVGTLPIGCSFNMKISDILSTVTTLGFRVKLSDSFSQWLTFKLSGITYVVRKIKFKLLFPGPWLNKQKPLQLINPMRLSSSEGSRISSPVMTKVQSS